MDNKEIRDEEKRDLAKDKKKLKKGLIIVLSVFGALLLLLGALWLVTEWLGRPQDERPLNELLFFEADYNKNIYEDEAYMSKDRGIHYNRYGFERVITKENAADYADGVESAMMFVDYFACVADGDYEKYPSFFTEECLNDKNFELPEKFTMQAIYDINVTIEHPFESKDGELREKYKVSYRIFENNGTFRDDIYPDETRTLVFEVVVADGEAKISAIGKIASDDE